MDILNMPKGPFCQSCGLPLESPTLFGTDATGIRINEYCIYCYHNGAFTEPAVSRDEIIARMADHLVKGEHLHPMEARTIAERFVPNLKRFAADGPYQATRCQ